MVGVKGYGWWGSGVWDWDPSLDLCSVNMLGPNHTKAKEKKIKEQTKRIKSTKIKEILAFARSELTFIALLHCQTRFRIRTQIRMINFGTLWNLMGINTQ